MQRLKCFAALVLPLVFLASASAQDQLAAVESFGIDAIGSSAAGGYVRVAPAPRATNDGPSTRPFHSFAVGLSANALGASFESATPLSRSFNLRSSVNAFPFNYPLTVDGVNYDARLHLKSVGTMLDWFPKHRGFHVSPGFLYVKNTIAASASVAVGMPFSLGGQPYTNSVNDPVGGSAAVVFPHKFAPMLLMGFGNLIPRSGRHWSIPVELGAAYTGAPTINVALSGTACSSQGCSSFDQNQTDVRSEVDKINEDLKRLPIYPIFSMGVAYRF